MLLLFLLCFTKDLSETCGLLMQSGVVFVQHKYPWSRTGTSILEVAAEGTVLSSFSSSIEYSETVNRSNSEMIPINANFRWDHSLHHLSSCFVKVKMWGDSSGNGWVPVEQVVYSPNTVLSYSPELRAPLGLGGCRFIILLCLSLSLWSKEAVECC